MEQSESIDQLAVALAQAQAVIDHAPADRNNPAFRSKYADLGSVIDAVKPALNKHGLSFLQAFEPAPEGHLMLTTMLLHASGQWLRSTCLMPLAKLDPQGYGSAATYARRYGLMAVCGIAAEDDDGNAACGRNAPGRQERPPNVSVARPAAPNGNGSHGKQVAREHVQGTEKHGTYAAATTPRPTPPPEPPNWDAETQKPTPPAASPTPTAEPADPSALICSAPGCGKTLTRGQHDISIRAFGQPLCPADQKERARASA